jgi:hypothetical protein
MTISITHDVKDGANVVTLRLNHYRCLETAVTDKAAIFTCASMAKEVDLEFGKQVQLFLLAARGSIKNDRARERANLETIESLRSIVKAMDKPARTGAPVLQMPALAAKRGPGRPPKISPIMDQSIKRGPGRPRKIVNMEPVKRGPGRPLGSKNKVY